MDWSQHALPPMRPEPRFGDRVVPAFAERPGSLWAMIADAVAENGDGEALVCGTTRLSWREVAEQSAKVAAGFSKLGLAPGDRVAILLGNRIEFVLTMFAAAHAGLVTVLLSTRQQKPEIAYVLNDCGARCLVHEATLADRIPDAAGTTVPVQLGSDNSISTIPTLIFAVGVLLMGVLVVRRVPGGLLIGIAITTVLSIVLERIFDYGSSVDNPSGWGLSVPDIPSALGGLPDLSLVGDVDLFGAFTRIGVLAASVLVFALVLSNFFDAMGTMTGLGKEAGLADEKGNLPGIGRALVVEGTGAIAGGAASASSNTVFVESASGIAEGARTGLANVVTGILFLVAMFLTPLYEVIPLEAVAPALVVVGAMMIGQLTSIDFKRLDYALPAFLTVVSMPFTYSIANGIGIGFISWVVMATAAGKARTVHPLLWFVAAIFVAYFARGPISDLIG